MCSAAPGAGSDGALRRFRPIPQTAFRGRPGWLNSTASQDELLMGRKREMRRPKSAVGLGSLALLLLALLLAAEPVVAQGPAPGNEDPNNWPQYQRTYNGWRYSPLDQIDKTNVGKLKVAWIHQGGDITMGIQETPIVVDG